MVYPDKITSLTLGFLLSAVSSFCQTPKAKEFLKQKKTQRAYFAEQFAHLQVYREVLEKGYDIAGKGLSIIGDHETETRRRNDDYLTSLAIQNQSISDTQSQSDIIATQSFIIKSFQQLVSECNQSDSFTAAERKYIETVSSTVRTKASQTVIEFGKVATNFGMINTDEEKMQRINKLAADMQEHKNFTMAFCASTRSLGAQRAKEKRETLIKKQLNVTNP